MSALTKQPVEYIIENDFGLTSNDAEINVRNQLAISDFKAIGIKGTRHTISPTVLNERGATRVQNHFKFFGNNCKINAGNMKITNTEFTGEDYSEVQITNQQLSGFNEKSAIYSFASSKIEQETPIIKSKYHTEFEELGELGVGGFGAVFKVRHNIDDQIYAIKRINLSDSNQETKDYALREVKTLAQIKSDRVVDYKDSWVQNKCLYVRMEFCSDNLKNTIQQKRDAFKRTSNQVMDVIEYHISCQMLRELLECVRYLHELDPPIIHRDLKPHNVLVLEKPFNGKYLKICDFNLAVIHDMRSMTHTEGVGTLSYMAPEILDGKYDLKVDVYSLGKIIEELFDLDIKSSYSAQHLFDKIENMSRLVLSMTNKMCKLRPTCAQVMDVLDSISFDVNEIKARSEFKSSVNNLKSNEKQIFLDYLIK